jgi:hypothetical protein
MIAPKVFIAVELPFPHVPRFIRKVGKGGINRNSFWLLITGHLSSRRGITAQGKRMVTAPTGNNLYLLTYTKKIKATRKQRTS